MRICVLDCYYPDFLNTLPPVTDYASGLAVALSRMFGTFDAYSRNLRMLGHDAIDIIANHEQLQNRWAVENNFSANAGLKSIALQQIKDFKPEVIFCQDLSFFDAPTLRYLGKKHLLAGQCSCAMPKPENVGNFDVLFTSFPFYLDRFKEIGVRGEFLPLAFDPLVLERAHIPVSRTHAVSFVGGYGRHWETDRLFTVLAERTPIEFWGYGFESAPKVIRDRWRGECWGLGMYSLYADSSICINRHGGISGGFANNLRMYEVTGMGSMLITEDAPNLHELFPEDCVVTYSSPDELCEKIHYYLEHDDDRVAIASRGQSYTLKNHNYFLRMKKVSEVITGCLSAKDQTVAAV